MTEQLLMDEAAARAARALAQAIAETPEYREFEAANDALERDNEATARLRAFVARQEQLRTAALWGGAAPDEQLAAEREWRELSHVPPVRRYLLAQAGLQSLFRDVTLRISSDIGVDFGASCSPNAGCC